MQFLKYYSLPISSSATPEFELRCDEEGECKLDFVGYVKTKGGHNDYYLASIKLQAGYVKFCYGSLDTDEHIEELLNVSVKRDDLLEGNFIYENRTDLVLDLHRPINNIFLAQIENSDWVKEMHRRWNLSADRRKVQYSYEHMVLFGHDCYVELLSCEPLTFVIEKRL